MIRVRGRPNGLFNPCACWRGVWARRWLVVVVVALVVVVVVVVIVDVVVVVGPWRDRPTHPPCDHTFKRSRTTLSFV